MQVEARLRALAAIARRGSFSRAAEELFISQPAVSKHIASLESELRTRLVDRERSGARLTEAGERLADYVLRAEALLANGRRAIDGLGETLTGPLSLAASGIPGTYLIPELVARFHADHPGVDVSFELHTSGGALEAVRMHRVEIAVVGGLVIPPELECEALVEDDVVLIGPPWLGRRRLTGDELTELTWIYREEGSATRAAVEAACWEIGLNVRRRLALPSWEAVKLEVARGAGVAACSRFALEVELKAGTLVVLDVPAWHVHRLISVVRARDVPLTPPAEGFYALLTSRWRSPSRPPQAVAEPVP
jgi:LysR family transcriptional regulator, transcriptional activator of the cysJI operon